MSGSVLSLLYKLKWSEVKVAQSCLTLWDPMDYTVHEILQARILEWVSPSLLQGIFPTQGSNLGLPHCRQILYQLSHQGSPRILEWAAYPFSRGSSHNPGIRPESPASQADSLPAEPQEFRNRWWHRQYHYLHFTDEEAEAQSTKELVQGHPASNWLVELPIKFRPLLSKLWKLVMDREDWHAASTGSQRVGHDWATELRLQGPALKASWPQMYLGRPVWLLHVWESPGLGGKHPWAHKAARNLGWGGTGGHFGHSCFSNRNSAETLGYVHSGKAAMWFMGRLFAGCEYKLFSCFFFLMCQILFMFYTVVV